MRIIKQLPDEVVSKIAAGEVIERPAYVIKELIENALDATASQITILVEDAGLGKIIVTDNGSGMSSSDLKISYLPHTTSKIYSEDELVGIRSLGFRGEALSSMAAISKLTIRSKTKQEKNGIQVIVANSKLKSIKPIGMPNGTQVIVEHLFASVPVRKKFLKTKRTEYRHILDTIINSALSNDGVSFEFLHNGKVIFNFSSSQKLAERLHIIFGDTVANNLVPLRFEDSYITLLGFLGRPQISSTNTNKIYLFVNGRRVYDPLITSAIKDAYTNLLDPHSYPIAILFLFLPHALVDVNVHPRKEHIKFVDSQNIYSTFNKAVTETLKDNNLTFYNISWKERSTSTDTAQLLKSIVLDSEIANIGKTKQTADVIQLHNLYLITQTKKGIMFIDQHAAHEAILYRKFQQEFLNQKSKTLKTALKKSQLLKLSLPDFELFNQYKSLFDQIGFEIEEFGRNALKINAVPQLLKDSDLAEIISEILDDLREEKIPKDIDKKTNKMLSYLACRSAIKSGQKLTKVDIKKLIKQLEKEDFLYTCPHGRPVKVEISLAAFDKLFYRR